VGAGKVQRLGRGLQDPKAREEHTKNPCPLRPEHLNNPAKHHINNNEYITPGNGAQPHHGSYDTESASQYIDVTGRTIADCAQLIFTMSATERIEGAWGPHIEIRTSREYYELS
jgi:hypothetical protein